MTTYDDGDRVEVHVRGQWRGGHVLGVRQDADATRYFVQLTGYAAMQANDPDNWFTTDQLRAA